MHERRPHYRAGTSVIALYEGRGAVESSTDASPRYKRTVSSLSGGLLTLLTTLQHIADASDRLNPRSAELLSNVADVDVDDVRVSIIIEAPDVFDELVAREHAFRMFEQIDEQIELTSGQVNFLPLTHHFMAIDVDGQPFIREDPFTRIDLDVLAHP